MSSKSPFDAQIKELENTFILKVFPEFEQEHCRALAMVMETVCLQWLISSMLGKRHKEEAHRANAMIMAVVYRAMDEFDDFQREIIRSKIMDQNFMVPALRDWMGVKEEIHKLLTQKGESTQGDA